MYGLGGSFDIMLNMFRKQKLKDHLLIIGDYRHLRGGQDDRIKSIKITENEVRPSYKAKANVVSNLCRMYSQDSAIAVIDKNEDAWLIGQPFKSPINISELIRRKATRVFLGEKELILQSKDEYFLVNWGSIKTLDQDLLKISTFSTSQYDELFMAYRITSAEEGTIFYYSLEKKVENSNRLFEIRNGMKEIVGHPTLTRMQITRVMKGISVGKHHSLGWDNEGKLYSWGCRSLALGYGHLPSEDLIESPRQIQIGKYILMAYAATHYSLALTSQGTLYEWGIKMEFNEINEEPIFKPRQLDFRFFNCTAKFVSLKGRDNNFAALSSTGQLYVWGLNAKHLLSPSMKLPPSWRGTYIYEPVLQTELLGCKIMDFTIEMGYIGVILGCEESIDHPEEEYWQLLKEKAKVQLVAFKSNRIKTDCSEHLTTLRKKYKNAMLGEHNTERRQISSIDRKQIETRRVHRQKHCSMENLKINPFKKTAPALTATCWPVLSNSISISFPHKRQVSDCIGYTSPIFRTPLQSEKDKAALRCSQTGQSTTHKDLRRQGRIQKKFSQAYNLKLQGVLEKKRKLEIMSLTTNLKRIDEQNVEFRQRRKEEEQANRKKIEDKRTLQENLMPFLIKSFLAKLLVSPLQQGRGSKIGTVKRLLVMNKVESNIKKLFCDIKMKVSIHNVHPRYALLAIYFKNYVIKFRARKRQAMRRTAVQAIVGSVLREKVRMGLARLVPRVRKIGKLGEWWSCFNAERIKILRQLWNNYMIASFRTIDGGQINLHNFSSQITFREKYAAALEARTIGSLQHYYKGLVKRCERRTLTKKTLSDIKRRANAKFIEQFREKLSSLQILPYSLHYNTFKRPKNLQIIVAESIKTSPGWVQIQRRTLLELLTNVLRKSDRAFLQKQRQYEFQLANFLRSNYDTFYQLRWKYIIEYNKVQRTMQKRRREKELRRLLGLVGMQKLVEEDCIPEKNLVLEEALRRRDVPRAPSAVVEFDLQHFEGAFRVYWQTLNTRAKQLRKKNI